MYFIASVKVFFQLAKAFDKPSHKEKLASNTHAVLQNLRDALEFRKNLLALYEATQNQTSTSTTMLFQSPNLPEKQFFKDIENIYVRNFAPIASSDDEDIVAAMKLVTPIMKTLTSLLTDQTKWPEYQAKLEEQIKILKKENNEKKWGPLNVALEKLATKINKKNQTTYRTRRLLD